MQHKVRRDHGHILVGLVDIQAFIADIPGDIQGNLFVDITHFQKQHLIDNSYQPLAVYVVIEIVISISLCIMEVIKAVAEIPVPERRSVLQRHAGLYPGNVIGPFIEVCLIYVVGIFLADR